MGLFHRAREPHRPGAGGGGLIAWHGRTVTITDWQRLQAVAEFDPTFLNLARRGRSGHDPRSVRAFRTGSAANTSGRA